MARKAAKPTSLGDIAREAGVSRMAVSYALRNHPKISETTRQRIQDVAQKMNYLPVAAIAESMAHVRKAKTREAIPLAWVTNDPENDIWRKYSYLSPFLEGAERRCRELGYKLELIWARAPGMTIRRISSILFNRGIQGVVLAPSLLNPTEHYRLNWKHLACVSFERAVLAPRVHRVTPDYNYNMQLALKMLRRSGYRRIGVLLSSHFGRRSQHTYSSAVSYFHTQIPVKERIAPLYFSVEVHERSDPGKAVEARGWLAKYKPDVIICHHSGVPAWLKSLGYRVPDDIGVVHLAIEDDVKDWAGIWQRKREIGAESVGMLVSMLRNNQFGLPEVPHDTLIQGYWNYGWTLRIPKA